MLATVVVLLASCGGRPVEPGQASAWEPMADSTAGHGAREGGADHGMSSGTDPHAGDDPAGADQRAGLGLAGELHGFTLTGLITSLPRGKPTTLQFQISGPDGAAVTEYEPDRGRELHAYLIRADLAGYQHLLPEMAADGSWRVSVTVPESGKYRFYTSFRPAHDLPEHTTGPLVVSQEITVPGPMRTRSLYPPSTLTAAGDYVLTLTDSSMAAMEHPLTITFTKDQQRVATLEPYFGAYALVTAFHEGDLAFNQLQPREPAAAARGGPLLPFTAMLPSAGKWRMFIEFQVRGRVLTAPVTVVAH